MIYRLRALLRLVRWFWWGFHRDDVLVQRDWETLRYGHWRHHR